MDGLTVLGIFGLCHCLLFFFDVLFKSCSHYPYLTFLQATGLQVELLRIKWFTTALNRPLQKWGIWRPRFLQAWFSLGTGVSILLLPVSVVLVIRMGISALSSSGSSTDTSSMTLEPMIPGYNIPLSEMGYYIVTLLVCSFVHEVGHAVAAVREDVHVSGIGFFLLLILPVACVYLDTEQLAALPAHRRLRILCAGIWHNVYFAVLTALMVLSLPWISHPLYAYGEGVYVISISPESSVLGPSGLHIGDVITSVNHCEVKSSSTWRSCIVEALEIPTPGYCASAEFVRENDESIPERPGGGGVECCSEEARDSGRLCFQLVDESGGPVELPEHSCLSARALSERGNGRCGFGSSKECDSDFHCLRPTLANVTKLLSIHRSKGKVVLFLGNPAEIYSTVKVTDFIPRWKFLSTDLPQCLETLGKYLTTISAGLAIINILPCFFFDGQYIVVALCDLLLSSRVKDKNVRGAISLCATVLGTLLLVTAVLIPILLQIL